MPRPSGKLDTKLRRDNKSGCAGVWFVKARERWNAQLQLHCVRYCLGTYTTYQEAVRARRKAEEELGGL
jgi:hypothetical protein